MPVSIKQLPLGATTSPRYFLAHLLILMTPSKGAFNMPLFTKQETEAHIFKVNRT